VITLIPPSAVDAIDAIRHLLVETGTWTILDVSGNTLVIAKEPLRNASVMQLANTIEIVMEVLNDYETRRPKTLQTRHRRP